MADVTGGEPPSLADPAEPATLIEAELRRELANLDQIVREADLRGTPAQLVQRAKERLRQLNIEYRRRIAVAGH